MELSKEPLIEKLNNSIKLSDNPKYQHLDWLPISVSEAKLIVELLQSVKGSDAIEFAE